ncbi:hypothetical protein [Streptomyces sp. enrichment culture]|uniref:hypothetical protein n=1 Tax=Streptomyces sp. enrichment culture TaxID=1795815 RepID=UPI003F5544D6
MTRPDELRLEAARKRQELVETIDQLMAKTDLRARAARMDRRPLVAASAGTVALAVLGAVLTTRTRHRGGAAGAGAKAGAGIGIGTAVRRGTVARAGRAGHTGAARAARMRRRGAVAGAGRTWRRAAVPAAPRVRRGGFAAGRFGGGTPRGGGLGRAGFGGRGR